MVAFEPADGMVSDYLARKECGASATEEELIWAFNRWQDRVTGLGRRTDIVGQSIVVEVTPTWAEAAAIQQAREELAAWMEMVLGPEGDEAALRAYIAHFS